MSNKLLELDIQKYLHENMEKLPELIGLENLESTHQLCKEDLLLYPLKYLLNKHYQKIFKKMESFSEGFYKFSKEYNTAELRKSRPRIDILSYQGDPSTFYLTEVKWNNGPERQTITELLQYANGLQTNDFPGLPSNDIVFVVVAKEWSNILIQSVINGLVFKNLNILPIKVTGDKIDNFSFSFFDLWESQILENLNKQLYNEENYHSRMLAFDEFPSGNIQGKLDATHQDIQTISMATAVDLSKEGYIGYVLGMENEPNHMYKNAVAVLYFDPFSFYNKKWETFSDSKQDELLNFESRCTYDFNTTILRENIEFRYLGRDISFEEGFEGIGIKGLCSQGWLFSYGFPIGFLETLLKDFIKYCQEDINFALQTIQTDDVGSDGFDNISHWMYLNALFNYHK